MGVVIAAVNLVSFKAPARQPRPSVGLKRHILQFDPIGTIVLVPAIICLLLALQWGTTYACSSGRVVALLVVFAVCIVAFAAVQWWVGDNDGLVVAMLS